MNELSIVQKVYDLIKWYVPIINRLPRDHKLMIGNRMITEMYNFLDNLIIAQYSRNKLIYLEPLNGRLQILRYQTRLLQDLKLMPDHRYEYASQSINDIGRELGGWIKNQKKQMPNKKHETLR